MPISLSNVNTPAKRYRARPTADRIFKVIQAVVKKGEKITTREIAEYHEIEYGEIKLPALNVAMLVLMRHKLVRRAGWRNNQVNGTGKEYLYELV